MTNIIKECAMKIKLKDLHANPFRDIENYPLMPDKIKALEDSIEETGFWANMPVRENGDGYQIHYGHHRLQALNNLYGEEWEAEFPVHDVSDEVMHKRMIAENAEEWGATTRTIDENVKSAKEFLTAHLEIAAKYTDDPEHYLATTAETWKGPDNQNPPPVGQKIILRYLNSINSSWTKFKIESSLSRLKMLDEGVDKEAMETIESPNAAHNFAKAVSKYDLSPDEQKEVVAEIVESGNLGKDAITAAVQQKKHPKKKKVVSEEEEKRIKLLEFFTDISNTCDHLIDLIDNMREIASSDFILSQREQREFVRMQHSFRAVYDELNNIKSLEK